MVDQLPHIWGGVAQYSLDYISGHLLQEIGRIVHKQVIDNVADFLVGNGFYNILLHIAGEVREDFRSPIFGQGTEHHDHMFPPQFLHKGSDVSILQIIQFSTNSLEILLSNQTFQITKVNGHRFYPPFRIWWSIKTNSDCRG